MSDGSLERSFRGSARAAAVVLLAFAIVVALSPARAGDLADDARASIGHLASSEGDMSGLLEQVGWALARPGREYTAWSTLKDQAQRDQAQATNEMRAALAGAGMETPNLEAACYTDWVCERVLAAGTLAERLGSAEALDRARTEVMPLYSGFHLATAGFSAELANTAPPADIAARLQAAVLIDQVQVKGRRAPASLSREGAALWEFLMEAEARRTARRNAILARQLLDTGEWPRASRTGRPQAFRAWLIVQHADHDPLLQVLVLKLLDTLVPTKDASPSDFALLNDRVSVKLSGRQKFGSQMRCLDGKWAPEPLEDPGNLDKYRAEAGLPDMKAYIAMFPPSCT